MIPFILFLLSVVGMTHILVDSDLFMPVRDGLEARAEKPKVGKNRFTKFIFKVRNLFFSFANGVIHCHQCAGTWSGFLLGAILLSCNPGYIFACGCAGSYIATTAYLLQAFLITKTDYVASQTGFVLPIQENTQDG